MSENYKVIKRLGRKLLSRRVSFEEKFGRRFYFRATLMCQGYIVCDYRFELEFSKEEIMESE